MPLFSRRILYDRKRLIDQAVKLESSWRWRRAIVLYRQVLAAEPHDPELHARIAPLLARSGRRYEARDSFRLAQAGFRRLDDVARSEAMILEASKALPADPDVARNRATFERSKNRAQIAARVLLEASDRLARRRRGEAIILLRDANQIVGRHPEILIRLARLLFRDGQPEEALFWLEQLGERVSGEDLLRVHRLRLRIDPTFGNLWAWLRCRSDGRQSRSQPPSIEAT